jgi:hypothetical protein
VDVTGLVTGEVVTGVVGGVVTGVVGGVVTGVVGGVVTGVAGGVVTGVAGGVVTGVVGPGDVAGEVAAGDDRTPVEAGAVVDGAGDEGAYDA